MQLFDDPNEEQAFVAEYLTRPTQQPAGNGKPRGRGGTLTSLISEGGALGGAAAGAAIGSAVPVVGTAIGGIIGAGLGAFGGRLAENKVRDDRLGVGDAAKEGALSAVLAGPLKLGKYAMTAGKAGMAGKGLSAALTEGAEQATKFSLKGAVGGKIAGAGDDLAVKGFKFTPSQLTNFQKKYKEDAVEVIKRNNLIGASEDDFLGAIAGKQARFDELVNTAGTIKKSTLQKKLNNAYTDLVKQAPSDKKALGTKVKAEIDTLLEGLGDEIAPSDLNQIKKQFDELVNYTNSVADPARYGVNKRIADSLREAIQDASGSSELKDTGMEISKLIQLSDDVARQANRGRGANPLGLTSLLAGGVGSGMGGPGTAVASMAGAKFANSPSVIGAASKGLSKVGTQMVDGAPSTARAVMSGATRGAVGSSLVDAMTDQSLNSQAITQPIANAPISSNINELSAPAQDMSIEQSPYTREALIADIQRDPKNMKQYMEYYAMLDEIYNPKMDEAKPLSQGQQERADLITALGMAEDTVNAGSINYGPIGARVEGLKAVFNSADPETLNYKNVISGLRAAITKARAGASLTAGELAMLQKYTPSDTDSEQVVRSKLASLRQLYGSQQPQGGLTLQDALAMAQ